MPHPMNIRHIHLDKVDSTNNYLQCYKHAQDEDITFVWTDAQVAGRGCGANSWECEAGKNIAFSVLFHPVHVPASKQFIISMANALALKEALGCFTEDLTVKWPNDIYWKDFKLAGTLIEPSLRRGVVADCIIGTGINVNQTVFRSDAPNPVSLKQICARELVREEVASQVTERFIKYMTLLESSCNWPSIRNAYRGALYRKDGIHCFQNTSGECFKAAMHNVEDDGTLVLEVHTADDRTDLRKFTFKELKYII